MSRRAAVLVSLVLAAGGLVAAPAGPVSAAGTFKVTLASSAASADVGRTTVLSGRVTGKGSAGKKIAIDLRVGGGAWRRVTTTTTSSKGSFSVRVRLTNAGALAYRAVAPRSAALGTGVSTPVAVTGYRWLDLYDQPYLTGGGVVSRGADPGTTVGGKKLPAHVFGMGQGAYLYWNLDRLCNRVVAQAGMSDSDLGVTRTITFESDEATPFSVTGGEPLAGFADFDTTQVGAMVVRRPDSSYVYLVLPRAHCAAERLPVALD